MWKNRIELTEKEKLSILNAGFYGTLFGSGIALIAFIGYAFFV
jgi:hypothetical protein